MIAILYICTGNYDIFWKNFYESSERYFLKKTEKKYFVFTDSKKIHEEGNENVVKIYQKDLGWPNNTLMRFRMFQNISDQLKEFDNIFFFNANVLMCQDIGDEFLPNDKEFLAVLHPGFYDSDRKNFTYETNSESKAFIPNDSGYHYFMGGVNGGKSKNYIQLIKELAKEIDEDLKANIIAIWHDESHLNKYLIDKNVKILSPAYGYPEDWTIPFEQKILILDKNKYGGHDFLRGNGKNRNALITRAWAKFKHIFK